MPQFLSQNDSTGTDYIFWPLSACGSCSKCWGENKQERIENGRLFYRKYVGSDTTFGYWVFSVTTTFGFFVGAINFFTNTVPDTAVSNRYNI